MKKLKYKGHLMVRLLIEMNGKASLETESNMKSKKILKNVEGQNEKKSQNLWAKSLL